MSKSTKGITKELQEIVAERAAAKAELKKKNAIVEDAVATITELRNELQCAEEDAEGTIVELENKVAAVEAARSELEAAGKLNAQEVERMMKERAAADAAELLGGFAADMSSKHASEAAAAEAAAADAAAAAAPAAAPAAAEPPPPPPPPAVEWALGVARSVQGRLLVRGAVVPMDVPSGPASLVLEEVTPPLALFELPLLTPIELPVTLVAAPSDEEEPPPPPAKGKK